MDGGGQETEMKHTQMVCRAPLKSRESLPSPTNAPTLSLSLSRSLAQCRGPFSHQSSRAHSHIRVERDSAAYLHKFCIDSKMKREQQKEEEEEKGESRGATYG